MKRFELSRRTLLRGAGTLLALPVLEAMLPSLAHAQAQGAPAPRRLVGFYVPCGIHMQKWTPATTGTNYTLTQTLQPLAAMKSKFLVLTGLANTPARPDGPGDHASGTGAFFTAAHPFKTEGSDIRNGISVDQAAANHMKAWTRFPSIELGTDGGASIGGCDSGYSCAYARNIAWSGPSTPLPKEVNPGNAFNRLFSSLDPNQTNLQIQKKKAYGLSVLDFVSEDAQRLETKLGLSDRRKVDEYLTSVREVEQRIAAIEETTVCEVGTSPGAPSDLRAKTKAMLDIIALAFQCDVTRAATFMLGNAGSNRVFDFLGLSSGHHTYSHHQSDPGNYAALAKIDHWEIQQLAYLLQKLDAIQEPDGTVLDNSLIFFSSEIEDGNSHSHNNMPIILAGGGGGAVTPGRHVRYTNAPPVANLFVSMLHSVGVQTNTFGLNGTGPLGNLKL